MARVISTLFISADGVAEVDPEWHFPYFDEHMAAAVTEDYATANTLLLGRVTYDSFAGAWPEREEAGGEDAGFARELGDLRKVVATRSDAPLGWRNSEPVAGELTDAVAALREDPSVTGVLIPGSLSIVQQLLAAGLVDELRLLVHPVAAGSGRRLWADGAPAQHLTVVSQELFPTGVIRVIYAPAPTPAPVEYDEVAGSLDAG